MTDVVTAAAPAASAPAPAATRPRPSWPVRALAGSIALVLLAGLGVAYARRDRLPPHNTELTKELEIYPTGIVGDFGPPGTVEIARSFGAVPREPIILLDVRPYRLDPGVTLAAARVMFYGLGGISPSGHLIRNGAPIGVCTDHWPVAGYGPTYPVRGTFVTKNDPLEFLFYLRYSGYGQHTSVGYRLTYRTVHSGKVVTVTGDHSRIEVDIRTSAALKKLGKYAGCNKYVAPQQVYAQPVAGFPSD